MVPSSFVIGLMAAASRSVDVGAEGVHLVVVILPWLLPSRPPFLASAPFALCDHISLSLDLLLSGVHDRLVRGIDGRLGVAPRLALPCVPDENLKHLIPKLALPVLPSVVVVMEVDDPAL